MGDFSRYRIERKLGEGGAADVYEATDLERGHRVALKRLRDADPQAVLRFMREASLLQSLQSDQIVRYLDVGDDEGRPFLVMELLDGVPLDAVIGRGRAVDVATAADIAIQTCRGVIELHARGIIHRDIKPANLFVVGGSRIKLLDLGISKAPATNAWTSGDVLTRSDMLLGSPHFMSPEQLRHARSVDERTDVWSIGVVLYIAVTGYFPFGGTSIAGITTAIMERRPASLRSHGVHAPDVDGVISRCLEKERDARYLDVGELAVALAPIASPEWAPLADVIALASADLPTRQSPPRRR